jgi:chromosome segregation protein
VGVAHTQSGESKVAYVKLGELSFSALRLALTMKEQRVRNVLPSPRAGRIESVSFTGGLLDGRTITPSPEMTNLIGIRGSGKSSVLEAIRYAFEIDLKRLDGEDIDYKETLVQRILGSGGSVSIVFTSGDGTRYTVSRVLNDSPVVSRDGVVIPDIRPASLLTVRYFGQKDLARFSERQFAHELIERFAGGAGCTGENGSTDTRSTDDILQRIQSLLLTLQHHDASLAQLEEVRAQLAAVMESLKGFEEHNLHEKLQSQITFEQELRQVADVLATQDELVQSLQLWYDDNYEPYRRRLQQLDGSHLQGVREAADRFFSVLAGLQDTISALRGHREETGQARDRLNADYSILRDSFAEARRTLTLPDNLSPDTYLDLVKREKTLHAKLSELESIEKRRSLARTQLEQSLAALQQRWQEQFQAKKRAVEALNDASEGVQIELTFKANKDLFTEQLNTLTTGIQKRTVEKIVDTFSDGIEIYRDLAGGAHRLLADAGLNESQVEKLREAVDHNTQALVTFRPPDRVDLTYRGTPLHEHSLGQRATALMLFLLSQDEIDVLIVDQPEDDLDNQTVYAEIVSRILEKKGRQQIVFATHNPNIPVLGDAEQIVRCRFTPDRIDIAQGAVDSGAIQKEIVDVMEGGDDAFRRRQRIYDSWTR